MHDVRNQIQSLKQTIENHIERKSIITEDHQGSIDHKSNYNIESEINIKSNNDNTLKELSQKFSNEIKSNSINENKSELFKIPTLLKYESEINSLVKNKVARQSTAPKYSFNKNTNHQPHKLNKKYKNFSKVDKIQVLDLEISFDDESFDKEIIEQCDFSGKIEGGNFSGKIEEGDFTEKINEGDFTEKINKGEFTEKIKECDFTENINQTNKININNSEIELSQSSDSKNKEMKKQLQNLEIKKLIDLAKDPSEMLNVIKFINQKINFLYHIDLTFEENQLIKKVDFNPSVLLNYISKSLKILFMNKKNDLSLVLESNIEYISIDIQMLKYLICYIGLQLHSNLSNLNIQIKFELYKNNGDLNINEVKLMIKAQGLDKSNNNYLLNQFKIFHNLIINLHHDTNQDQTFDQSDRIHKININQNTFSNQSSQSNNQSFNFQEKIHIKNEHISHLQVADNVLIFNNQQFDVNNNHIFINVDDEANIKSMHTHLFKLKGINLICCSTENDLRSVLVSIYTQFRIEGIPKVVILLDNVLDGCTGLELYNQIKMTLYKFNFNVEWVLLSSTEDKTTIEKQRGVNINMHIEKPLTVQKINRLFNDINYEYKMKDENKEMI